MKAKLFLLAGLWLICFSACKREEVIPPDEQETGNISIKFTHYVDSEPLQTDTLLYVNAAGNQYMINEVQYFISDVVLISEDNSEVSIDDWEDIHYVDSDIPSTMSWTVPDKIKTGNYKAIRFIFGITQAKNISYMYVNPPERDMFWPEFLGGGYHYLKLNGKWKDTANLVVPFDFHLGIGQTYAGGVVDVDSITGFVQNYFQLNLQDTVFTVSKGATTPLEIRMNISNWFDTPHLWDHNVYGSYIMQNQDAMQKAKENGFDVFSYRLLN